MLECNGSYKRQNNSSSKLSLLIGIVGFNRISSFHGWMQRTDNVGIVTSIGTA